MIASKRRPAAAPSEPRARGAHLQAFVARRGTPRNQVAALSGLTNTYIRDLEGDRIQNVPRENLIALGAALNLKLAEIDDLLVRFDRAPLNVDDVDAFLSLTDRMELSNALHPCHNVFYELVATSCLRRSRRVVLVTDKPTSALRPEGYRSFFDRAAINAHPLYPELIERIGQQRFSALHKATAATGVEHYISLAGLERYVRDAAPGEDREWRRQHMGNLVALLRSRPRYELLVTNSALNFAYSISYPRDGARTVLCFEGQAAPGVRRGTHGRLTGFATTSPPLVECFLDDLTLVQQTVIDEFRDRKALIGLLEKLILA